MKNLILITLLFSVISNSWSADNCTGKEAEAMKDLVIEVAQAIPETMISSDSFPVKTVVKTLEGSQILNVAGNIETKDGNVLVLGTFVCFGGKYSLNGLVLR